MQRSILDDLFTVLYNDLYEVVRHTPRYTEQQNKLKDIWDGKLTDHLDEDVAKRLFKSLALFLNDEQYEGTRMRFDLYNVIEEYPWDVVFYRCKLGEPTLNVTYYGHEIDHYATVFNQILHITIGYIKASQYEED